MPYELINSAAINAGVEDEGTQGIELAQYGVARAGAGGLVAGSQPLAMGAVALITSLRPTSLELAQADVHALRYNNPIKVPGLELASTAPAVLDFALFGTGSDALSLGMPRVKSGEDVVLQMDGIELARTAQHGALPSSAPANVVVEVRGWAVLSLGTPTISIDASTVTVSGYAPVTLGTPGAGRKQPVVGYRALELGQPTASRAVQARGAAAISLGTPSISVRLAPPGITLSKGGRHTVAVGSSGLSVEGAAPLELGQPGAVSMWVRARQHTALELGTPHIDRGATC